ncbi:MAG TPA: N-acetylmuramic acid 6-phosphate etherase [Phycisphaerales bacterium]|nr:N-acetylmuramic acid 6-phosphate etherase [Phycisphaerales bacterium]
MSQPLGGISSIPDRSGLLTEQRNEKSVALDSMSVADILRLMNEEDASVAGAVRRALPEVASFVEAAIPRLRAGGRLIYIGAGTSGRLGVLDASECPPTFCTEPRQVVGIIAGGDGALRRSSEGAEDDPRGAEGALTELGVGPGDAVLGVAAGGTTPFVLGGLSTAHERGAVTGLLSCAPGPAPAFLRHHILVETGAEVLTGSTRLKAGTATKMVLNMISTSAFVRLGKCYENLMIDLRASNAKLRDRAVRIVGALCGLSREEGAELIDRARGSVKHAVLMARAGCSYEDADRRLARSRGELREGLRGGLRATPEGADGA